MIGEEEEEERNTDVGSSTHEELCTDGEAWNGKDSVS